MKIYSVDSIRCRKNTLNSTAKSIFKNSNEFSVYTIQYNIRLIKLSEYGSPQKMHTYYFIQLCDNKMPVIDL